MAAYVRMTPQLVFEAVTGGAVNATVRNCFLDQHGDLVFELTGDVPDGECTVQFGLVQIVGVRASPDGRVSGITFTGLKPKD